MLHHTLLEDRGLLVVSGADRVDFLQGLVSNDIRKVAPGRAVYATLLTPQGKYLHDFLVVDLADALALEVQAERLPDLQRRLRVYRLRSRIELTDATADWTVAALFGDGAAGVLGLPETAGAAAAFGGGIAFVDPRLAPLGVRLILPRASARETLAGLGGTAAAAEAYERWRLVLGVPDGSRDLIVEKSILLESNLDELNAIAWDKGCYMGQELTARTKYRGLIKKRLMPVAVDGPTPEPGTPVTLDGRPVGEMRSALDGRGLALIRLDALGQAPALQAGEATLRPMPPDWLRL